MMARLAGYIGAGERKRVPLGASCSDRGASELTRRLRADSGGSYEVRSLVDFAMVGAVCRLDNHFARRGGIVNSLC